MAQEMATEEVTTERDKRRSELKSYTTLLREARAHALGAQSIRPGPDLGKAIYLLGTLEGGAMRELYEMLREDHKG